MTGPGAGPIFGGMSEAPENHTLHLLREMRDESRAFRKEMRERFDGVDKRFSGVEERLDSIQSAVGGLAYIQADQRLQFEELEARVKRLEEQLGQAPAE